MARHIPTLEDFFRKALCNPDHAIAYHVSQALAAMFPERAFIEGASYSFSLKKYSAAGHCTVVERLAVHNQTVTRWTGKKIKRSPKNAWYEVLWRGQLLDVILMQWDYLTQFWIVADSRDIADGFFAATAEWSTAVRGEILVFESGSWRKDKNLFREIKGATFDNLVLPGALKQEIQEDITRFFASREIYERYGIPWKRGICFIGPPGNGKTHAVKALVNSLGKPCLYVKSLKAHCETDHGNIRSVFEQARRSAPCILVMEDLDSLVEGEKRALFLNELDGFAANTGILTLATTNHPERIDRAILERPSRFDRKYQFTLPERPERVEFIGAWNRSLQAPLRLSGPGIARIADSTGGFSFAYLKELFLSSMMRWAGRSAAGSMDGVILAQALALREQLGDGGGTEATAMKARQAAAH
jgi:AAA+ superfamily predicted ATPase